MYATQQDLIDAFGLTELLQRCDPEGTGTPDPEIVGRAIASAEAIVSGYLLGRYHLPLASVPALVRKLTCDLARYEYFSDEEVPRVSSGRKDAIRMLEQIAAGTVRLEAAGVEPDGQSGGSANAVEFSSGGRLFSGDTMKVW